MSRTWNTRIEQNIHFPPKSYSPWSLVSSSTLSVVRSTVSVVYIVLSVMYISLSVVGTTLSVVYITLSVVCTTLSVVRTILSVVCMTLSVVRTVGCKNKLSQLYAILARKFTHNNIYCPVTWRVLCRKKSHPQNDQSICWFRRHNKFICSFSVGCVHCFVGYVHYFVGCTHYSVSCVHDSVSCTYCRL